MKSIKEFCKKHKKELIIGGCLLGAALVVGITKGRYKINKKVLIDVTGKNSITWEPSGSFMSLEKVKDILELNTGNNESFAILKDGSVGKDSYSCILLSDNVIEA